VGCSDLDGWVWKEGGGVRGKGEELFKVRVKLEFCCPRCPRRAPAYFKCYSSSTSFLQIHLRSWSPVL